MSLFDDLESINALPRPFGFYTAGRQEAPLLRHGNACSCL